MTSSAGSRMAGRSRRSHTSGRGKPRSPAPLARRSPRRTRTSCCCNVTCYGDGGQRQLGLMSNRREVLAGLTARELRAALNDRAALQITEGAVRSELADVTSALYQRIGYPLGWLLEEGARAHVSGDLERRADEAQPRHRTQRECQRWQRATLLKIVAFARPSGIDLEDLEYQVARWREHAKTLGYAEAVARLAEGRARDPWPQSAVSVMR